MKALFALPKTSFPITGQVLYRAGTFYATDIESYVSHTLNVPGLPDNTLIPRDWLKIVFAHGQNSLTYSDGQLNGMPIPEHDLSAEDFPFLKTLRDDFESALIISVDDLKAVSMASAKTDIRYYLKGIFCDFDNKRIAASDGHRLHIQNSLTCAGAGSAILPNGALDMVFKAAEKNQQAAIEYAKPLSEEVGGGIFKIVVGDTVILIRAIDGKFPDIDRVTPNYIKGAAPAMVINSKQGVEDIKRYIDLAKASPTHNKKAPVMCAFKHQELNGSISLASNAFSMTGLDAIGIRASFVSDAIKFLDQDQCEFLMADANCSILGTNGYKAVVVMPCRM